MLRIFTHHQNVTTTIIIIITNVAQCACLHVGSWGDDRLHLCRPPDLQSAQVGAPPGTQALQCQGHDPLLQGGHRNPRGDCGVCH